MNALYPRVARDNGTSKIMDTYVNFMMQRKYPVLSYCRNKFGLGIYA